MTEPTDTCINCGQRLAYGVDPSCCSWSCDADLRRKLAELTAECELSKRVVTAHRKLCDERAARIKELEAALAEAEAIVVAAFAWMGCAYDESRDACMVLECLLAARREK